MILILMIATYHWCLALRLLANVIAIGEELNWDETEALAAVEELVNEWLDEDGKVYICHSLLGNRATRIPCVVGANSASTTEKV